MDEILEAIDFFQQESAAYENELGIGWDRNLCEAYRQDMLNAKAALINLIRSKLCAC